MGLAVSPYAPAWNTTTKSPTSAGGSITRSPRRSSGVHSLPTTLTVSVAALVHPVANCYRVVAPDYLTEIA